MHPDGYFEFALSWVPLPLWLIVTLHRRQRVGANQVGLREFMEIQFLPNSRAAAALSTHWQIYLHMGSGAKPFLSLQIGTEKDNKDPGVENDYGSKD